MYVRSTLWIFFIIVYVCDLDVYLSTFPILQSPEFCVCCSGDVLWWILRCSRSIYVMFYDVFCDVHVHTIVAWICVCCSDDVWWCSCSVYVMFYDVFYDIRIVYTWCSMIVASRKVYISDTWNIANPIFKGLFSY